MPIYEFHCQKCNKDSEVLVRTTQWDGVECPHCGSKRIEKKLSVFAASGSTEQPAPQCSGNPGSCGRCQMPG